MLAGGADVVRYGKLRLEDAPEGAVCLRCVIAFAAGVERCTSCGEPVVPVASVRDQLQRSGGGRDDAQRAGVLVRWRQVEEGPFADRLRAILVEGEAPHLEHVDEPATEDEPRLVSFFVMQEDAAWAERELDLDLVLVARAGDALEAEAIRTWFAESGIVAVEQHLVGQYGLTVGEWGTTSFLVAAADEDRARAALERHRPPPAEDPAAPADDEDDGLRELRRRRMASITRMTLALAAALHIVYALVEFASALLLIGGASLLFAIAFIAVYRWSRHNPLDAFIAGFLLAAVNAVLALFLDPLLAAPGLFTLAACLAAARMHPPQSTGPTGGGHSDDGPGAVATSSGGG
jgi:hypothetical protein